jgi:hypothetical protein
MEDNFFEMAQTATTKLDWPRHPEQPGLEQATPPGDLEVLKFAALERAGARPGIGECIVEDITDACAEMLGGRCVREVHSGSANFVQFVASAALGDVAAPDHLDLVQPAVPLIVGLEVRR